MQKLLLPIFLSIAFTSCGYNLNSSKLNPKDSILFVQKCLTFIKQVKGQELSDTNFILSGKPFSFEYFNCIEGLLSDTSFYTKEELTLIKEKKYPLISHWTNDILINIRIVSNDSINMIFKDRSKWWPYFHKHIGRSFSTFSIPIFLRNDTYCLFYSDNSCGGLCGEGRLTLYKKENNKWTEVKSYCNWIS